MPRRVAASAEIRWREERDASVANMGTRLEGDGDTRLTGGSDSLFFLPDPM